MEEFYQFPLKQHIGKEAVPIVVEGDEVVRGQLLSLSPEDALGSRIYSSVNGVVSEITKQTIYIKAKKTDPAVYKKLTGQTPAELIRESGLVGLGGAGFPTWAKFSKPFQSGGTVIVNAAECEPILSHNIARIEQRPQQLIRGLEIAMDAANAADGIIAVKAYHTKAVSLLKEAIAGSPKREHLKLKLLPDQYPMGEERALIREIFGKVLPTDALPLQADAIVCNAETICRIQEAVDLKKPLIDKDLTVAGKLSGNIEEKLVQIFLDVPLGISVQEMFRRAGGLASSYGELIMGGPFTGKRTTANAPIIKTTGGLIAAECFPKGPEKIGLLVCACGAGKQRLEEIAESMHSQVVDVQYCKQAKEKNGNLKCENPGRCPGQVQKIMALKKKGAEAVLISNCSDCSNTVMSCAPKMGLPVYHCTDGALRAVNHHLIRKFKKNM